MMSPAHCALMARYNRWMNDRLYALCAEITDAERKKDRGAFFRSIHGTLNHLLFGDVVWMGRFQGTGTPAAIIAELHADFGELRTAREAMDARILDWTATLGDGWLAAPFTYVSNVDRKSRTMPAWAAVAHLFNHQTHHRGQLTTLLSQLGIEPGVTDIPFLPEFTPGREVA
ncbi:MAG: damage-inducible protein DinB [Burkholderiales bacterium]|nr:damage-inducible protein DinB [Burkholderiales bacterium]